MDIRATFQLTAREYRSAIRNSLAIRAMLIISPLMAAFGLISRLSGGRLPPRKIRWYNPRSWR